MIEAFIEFMTTFHSGGPRGGAYGWVYFAAAASGIFGALAAREVRLRRQRTSTDAAAQAAGGSLYALAVIDQPSGQRRVDATIRASAVGFDLILRDISLNSTSETVRTFATMQEIQKYLEHNTVLRLGDFRAG